MDTLILDIRPSLLSDEPTELSPLSSPLTYNSPLAADSPRTTPISTGHKKKSAYRFGPRDSLASRYRIGVPGSRRYRKWHNEFFLLQNLSDAESATDLSDEWDSSCEPSFGSFSLVLDEYKEIWDPFIDITEEQQNILLGYYNSDSDYSDSSDYDNDHNRDFQPLTLSGYEAFTQIRNVTRKLLIRHRDNQLLRDLDETIFAYSTEANSEIEEKDYLQMDPSEGSLIFSLEEKFHRLLLHSLCEYYDMVSYSFGEEEKRQTVVYKRSDTPVREMALMDYLNAEEPNFQIV